MKITETWLREHLNTPLSLQDIGHILTDIGLEVEELVPPRTDLEPFKTARIVHAEPHPNAQKLQVCQVETGDGRTLTIVCGAPNARAGLHVVLAPIGAVIPGSGLVIQPTEIRGVRSEGMLCSAQELSLGGDSEGIIELPEGTPLGQRYQDWGGWNESILDINITPNRGDCLSVRGIARDLAAKGIGTLRPLDQVRPASPLPTPEKRHSPSFGTGCSFFFRAHVLGIKHHESPLWLKRTLSQVGLKSVSAPVDILQWVMWDLGVPMHVYDASTLAGDLVVHHAAEGETFEGLNGRTYTLSPTDLVVHDGTKTVALAGILGSQATACTLESKDLCIEAALFDMKEVTRTGQRLMIPTDARSRFERGVDPERVRTALTLALHHLVEICQGKVSNLDVWGDETPPRKAHIPFRLDHFKKRTGIHLTDGDKAFNALAKLGCALLDPSHTGCHVVVPSWRYDLTCEEDLIEEVLRLIGYDQIPEVSPQPTEIYAPRDERIEALNRIRQTLAYQGYHEVVNWSFMHEVLARSWGQEPEVYLDNPISQELNAMRTSLLPQMVSQIQRNLDHGVRHAALFEIGPVFKGITDKDQELCIAGVRVGSVDAPHWHRSGPLTYDVFDLKADLWRLMETWGFQPDRVQIFTQNPVPSYHPGRSATLQQGPKNILGTWGELHPAQQKAMGLDVPVVMFELWVDRWPKVASKAFRPVWDPMPYPAVWRDFAFIIETSVKVGDMIRTIQSIDPQLIRNVQLFDLYEDPTWEKQRRSYAFRVQLQSAQHTLTEQHIQAVSDQIIQKMAQTWNAQLRNA